MLSILFSIIDSMNISLLMLKCRAPALKLTIESKQMPTSSRTILKSAMKSNNIVEVIFIVLPFVGGTWLKNQIEITVTIDGCYIFMMIDLLLLFQMYK